MQSSDLTTDPGASGYSLKSKLEAVEKAELIKALENGGTTRQAAKKLGIDQSSVVRKMKKYGVVTMERF